MSEPGSNGSEEVQYARARADMVDRQLAGRDITDTRVLDAMRRIPRHLFVPPYVRDYAYADGAYPIGEGQTISQPYIVALMTQLLKVQPTDRVLEIGVGSGYQTAVLAELANEVIGVERIPALAQEAEARLHEMGYQNLAVHVGDGTEGFAQAAPYDAILAAAVAPTIPEPLIEQLADGGRLVIPVGDHDDDQYIERVYRRGKTLHIEKLTPVRFVRLIGKHGFEK